MLRSNLDTKLRQSARRLGYRLAEQMLSDVAVAATAAADAINPTPFLRQAAGHADACAGRLVEAGMPADHVPEFCSLVLNACRDRFAARRKRSPLEAHHG